MKQEINKRKVNKRAELIETVWKFWNDQDQEIILNYMDSICEIMNSE